MAASTAVRRLQTEYKQLVKVRDHALSALSPASRLASGGVCLLTLLRCTNSSGTLR